ncbi:MAG: SURF1 family protein [Parvibaculum sp.]|nr:SURF1 family protein [Parvibaculum sp.]
MATENHLFRPMLWPTLVTLFGLIILVSLGTWQVERLYWKRDLMATIAARMAAPATDIPPQADWAALDLKRIEYHHVKLSGHFINASELYYFAQDEEGTSGFDIVTPFMLDDGRIVLVDRGFVPKELREPATRLPGRIEGPTTLVAVTRAPQQRGIFTAPDDAAGNIWFTRDPAAMAEALKLENVAPFYVEADATPNAGGFPVGGQTKITIPNNHLQYAITWYGLAIVLLVIYLSFHWSNGRIGRRPE